MLVLGGYILVPGGYIPEFFPHEMNGFLSLQLGLSFKLELWLMLTNRI